MIQKIWKLTSWVENSELVWGLPCARWLSLKLPWTSLSVFQPLACFETCWILLSKSSCRARVWKCKLMMEVFQSLFEWLDSFYMMYRWCLKWKFGKRTSGFEVGLLKLKICTNGVFLVILSFGCFCDGWKWCTTSKWGLEDVWMIGLDRNCKGWKIRFLLLWT